ncbi:MAG: iron-sulfur cluster assembly accessory protein, partial [Candidatus Magasanikbacteria bacterium]|nr:iron-sulfur cluster assembly accessory protein [Candidatus Magasanikbacteria bacterium]
GCAGFSYEWDVIKKDELKDEEIIELRDTDYVFAVDVIAIMYLIGSTIDYKTDIMGSMLTVVNPNSTSSCGCGESVAFG